MSWVRSSSNNFGTEGSATKVGQGGEVFGEGAHDKRVEDFVFDKETFLSPFCRVPLLGPSPLAFLFEVPALSFFVAAPPNRLPGFIRCAASFVRC